MQELTNRHLPAFRQVLLTLAISALAAGCSAGSTRSSLLLSGVTTASIETAVAKSIGSSPSELKHALDPSAASERNAADGVTNRLAAKVGFSTDKPMQRYLQKMLDRLTAPLNTNGVTYEVVLLKDSRLNAYTPGAGKIIINEGLLMYCNTEGQVAAVMAHEIAHVAMRHPLRVRQVRVAAKAGDALLNAVTPPALEDNIGKALRLGGKATMNTYLRTQETTADSIGIDIMAAAGYDPHEMVSLLRQLKEYTPQMARLQNIVYGNHPLSADREAAAERKVSTYYALRGGTISTPAFNKLDAKYHARRLALLSQIE